MRYGERPRILILGWNGGSANGRLAHVAAALGGCQADTGALTRGRGSEAVVRVDGLEIIAVPDPAAKATPRALAGLAKRLADARTISPNRADPIRSRLADHLSRIPVELVHVTDERWLAAVSLAYSGPSSPHIVLDPGLAADRSAPPGAVELVDTSAAAIRNGYAATGVVPAWEPGPVPEVIRTALPGDPPRIGIGLSNFASQGWQWMRALSAAMPEASTMVLAKKLEHFDFPSDVSVSLLQYHADPIFRGWIRREVLGTWTHAVVESGRGMLGAYSGTLTENLEELRFWGVEPALLFHGTDIRNPEAHAATHPNSPYRKPNDSWVKRQQLLTTMAREAAMASGAPIFVSTPDLLEYVPNARWLPVVSEMVNVRGDRMRPERPVVLHAPSDSQKKGSDLVDPILTVLNDAGIIEYRRLRGVPTDQMPAWLSDADIVVDQFAIGSYGVLAVEAMRCGAAVVSDVDEAVRTFVEAETGLTLPILQATPETLARVVSDLARSPEAIGQLAERGRAFADEVHDGRLSGGILAEWVRATAARQ